MRAARPGRRVAAATAAALALAAAACAPPAQRRYEEELSRTPPAAAHAVHAERLAGLMRGLARLTRERLPQALDVEAARARRAAEVREAALAVADSAARIPAAADAAAPRDAAARAAFRELAATLEARARGLAAEAEALPEPALRRRLDALEEVCQRCHARFRIPR